MSCLLKINLQFMELLINPTKKKFAYQSFEYLAYY